MWRGIGGIIGFRFCVSKVVCFSGPSGIFARNASPDGEFHFFKGCILKQQTIGIVGLGYVGLPLAVEFGKAFDTIGFDISSD